MTELPECTVGSPKGVLHLDAFDLGGGMTSYLEAHENKGAYLVITSCHTGQTLRATVWLGPEKRRRDFAALDEFDDSTGEDVIVNIEQLAEGMLARDVPTVFRLNRKETCACAAAYPGLRGTKQGYATQ